MARGAQRHRRSQNHVLDPVDVLVLSIFTALVMQTYGGPLLPSTSNVSLTNVNVEDKIAGSPYSENRVELKKEGLGPIRLGDTSTFECSLYLGSGIGKRQISPSVKLTLRINGEPVDSPTETRTERRDWITQRWTHTIEDKKNETQVHAVCACEELGIEDSLVLPLADPLLIATIQAKNTTDPNSGETGKIKLRCVVNGEADSATWQCNGELLSHSNSKYTIDHDGMSLIINSPEGGDFQCRALGKEGKSISTWSKAYLLENKVKPLSPILKNIPKSLVEADLLVTCSTQDGKNPEEVIITLGERKLQIMQNLSDGVEFRLKVKNTTFGKVLSCAVRVGGIYSDPTSLTLERRKPASNMNMSLRGSTDSDKGTTTAIAVPLVIFVVIGAIIAGLVFYRQKRTKTYKLKQKNDDNNKTVLLQSLGNAS